MLKNRSLKHYALLTWLLLGFLDTQAQTDLCLNGTGTISIDKTTGCSPLSVNITSPTNLNTVTFIYDYKIDGVLNTAPSAEVSTLNNDYLTNANIGTRVFTVLQKGLNAAGQNIYACANITVKPGSKLDLSYTICNNNVAITIPNTLNNQDFNSIQIDWDDASLDNINSSSLPFNRTKSLSLPKNIKIKANSVLNTCDYATSIQAVALNPSSFPLGYDLPYHPNISKLELFNKGKVELTIKGDYESSGYNLFMYPKATFQVSMAPTKNGVLPGKIELIVPDTTQSYCFFISKNISCGLVQSNEICTIPITQIDISNPTKNKISWEIYPDKQFNMLNEIAFGRYLFRELNMEKSINGISSNQPLFNPNLNSFEENIINCSEKRCYQIKMKTSGQLYYYKFSGESISNKVCLDRKEFKPPKITDLLVTINENTQKPEIIYTDNSGWNISKNYFYLFKVDGNKEVKIDSSNSINSFFDGNKLDYTLPTCYKIGYKDVCNSSSILSDDACTINLKFDSNKLSWSNNSPFSNSNIVNYEIINFQENTNAEIRLSTLLPGQNQYEVDLNDQNYIFEAKYKIKAQNTTLNLSNSNTVSIPIEVKVFLPDVFTPNSDANNSEWFAQGKLSRLAKFDLKIYDRWGGMVYQSTDKNFKWDGRSKGKLLVQGSYFYKLDMNLDTGESQTKTGEILILY